MTARLTRFLFEQPAPFHRLALVRVALGLVTAVLVSAGPYDHFFVDTAGLLYRPGSPLAFLPDFGEGYSLLRIIVIVSAVAFMAGLWTRVSGGVLAISFLILNFYVSRFSSAPWSYNTHLNFFLIAAGFVATGRYWSIDAMRRRAPLPADTPGEGEIASFVVSFMQLFVGVLYFQAGLSKLRHSGLEWYLGGQTFWATAVLTGTHLGRRLAAFPALFRVGAMLGGAFELLIAFLVPLRRAGVAIVVMSSLFHLSLWLILGISFWHLWMLVPVLFLPIVEPSLAAPMCPTSAR